MKRGGDIPRYKRYLNGGGDKNYVSWYSNSRGGRAGGAGHTQVQEMLAARGLGTEVQYGRRAADAAGPGEIHQIGGLNKRGDPIARERDAINEIIESQRYIDEGMPTIYFWDKNNPLGKPIVNPHLQGNWGAR